MPSKLLIRALMVGVVGIAATMFLMGFLLGRAGHDSGYALLDQAKERIELSALEPPNEGEMLQGALRGLMGSLGDPHSTFMTEAGYRVFSEEISTGAYTGVGIWLNRGDELIRIVAVVPGGPADEAGIVPGDEIETVDGTELTNLSIDDVAAMILGEEGTKVTLRLVPETGDPKQVTLERAKIEIPAIEHDLQDGIGVINLYSFTGGVGEKVREAVRDLEEKGAEGILLDMRGNPGGGLDEGVEVASAFIADGVIVSYEERDRDPRVFEAVPPLETELPLVVLVDEGSASASEIVAAAVQDTGRGVVVGTSTYGKGSVQQIFGLSDGSAVKITVATYYTPSGKSIGPDGLTPDVLAEDRETQVADAIEVLRGLIAEPAEPAA